MAEATANESKAPLQAMPLKSTELSTAQSTSGAVEQ
jgi:hypothetical protein